VLSLGELAVAFGLLAVGAWLWHAHGRRELALALVRQACLREDVLLLDDNVAFRGLRLLRDRNGQRRLVREFAFEFTVTGEQRHPGRILLRGRHPLRIELAPHPMRPPEEREDPLADRVIHLDAWRQRQQRPPRG
jgi:hypothetical protein